MRAWINEAAVIIPAAWMEANRVFARADALRLLPPPKNKTVEDLNAHIRAVVFKRRGA